MKVENKKLLSLLKACPDDRQKQSDLMKDYYKGDRCFIFSCGPSLNDLNVDLFKERFSSDAVLTVKQAYFKFKDIVDFAFFNLGNFTELPRANDSTIFAGESLGDLNQSRMFSWGQQEVNICDRITNDRNVSNCLAYSKNFSEWEFDNSLIRPWGPGIMYEQVIFHAIHLGFKEIYVCGWDYDDPNKEVKQLKHFYNKDGKAGGLRFFRNKSADMFNTEVSLVVGSSHEFITYLNEKKIKLALLSDKSYLSNSISRIKLEDILV